MEMWWRLSVVIENTFCMNQIKRVNIKNLGISKVWSDIVAFSEFKDIFKYVQISID